MSTRDFIAVSLVRGDNAMHRLGWSPRWLCEGAEVTYGFGSGCVGWDDYGRLAHWLERWLKT